MEELSVRRVDFIEAFNQSKFQLRYFSRTNFQVYTPDWNVMPVNRLFFPLINPNGAENYIEDQHGKNILAPGNLYFVPPYLPSRWKLSGQLNFLSIHANLEIFPGVELFANCSKMLVLPKQQEIEQLLEYVHSPSENTLLDSQRAGALVYTILVSLIEHYPETDFWGPLSLRRYSKIAEYLIHHGNAKTSVSEIAEICSETRESFSRNFKSATGITPKQLIDRYLIRRCVDLLSSGNNIKEVAYQLKFSNEFAFSRYFKRLLGESPGNWRKHHEIISFAKK